MRLIRVFKHEYDDSNPDEYVGSIQLIVSFQFCTLRTSLNRGTPTKRWGLPLTEHVHVLAIGYSKPFVWG